MEQTLLFRLGSHLFGLEIFHVQEVVEAPPVYFIPGAPGFFAGAMNFHSQIVPVLDLGAFLGIAGEERDPRVIVLPGHLCALGLAVTAVRRIVPLDPDALAPYRDLGGGWPVRHLLERDGEMIHMLDVAALVARLEQVGEGRR
jgi:chemotaxis signal transduction protein